MDHRLSVYHPDVIWLKYSRYVVKPYSINLSSIFGMEKPHTPGSFDFCLASSNGKAVLCSSADIPSSLDSKRSCFNISPSHTTGTSKIVPPFLFGKKS